MSIPTKIEDDPWVYHGEQEPDVRQDGKWMLFYPKTLLDSKWTTFCNLYDNDKIKGILRMKCSTNWRSDRSSDPDGGVIILYCTNSSNAKEIINIGKGILPYLKDYQSHAIYYKTTEQTFAGTKSTGCKKNYTYFINIPK